MKISWKILERLYFHMPEKHHLRTNRQIQLYINTKTNGRGLFIWMTQWKQATVISLFSMGYCTYKQSRPLKLQILIIRLEMVQ